MPTVSEEAPVKTSASTQSDISTAYIGVALASCASLLLELALTRLFSVVLFYHFAFLAISVALLGLGAGGVFACVFRHRLAGQTVRRLGFLLCAANAIVIVLALEVVLHLPVSLDLSAHNFLRLTAVYLSCAAPFFLTGLLFSVVFARRPDKISYLYGFDLAGGALACILVVPLLNWIGGPNAVLFSALLMAAGAMVWSETRRSRAIAAGGALLLLAGIAANFSGRLVDVIYAKGKFRPRESVLYSRWNAISRIEVDQEGLSRYIVIDADANSAVMNVDPRKWDAADSHGYIWKSDLMSTAPSVVNVLRPEGSYAIIGPGGGVDVLRAVASGSKNVTAVEINPIIANDVMRSRFADYAYHLYQLPEVHIHVGDGRSFIRNAPEQYDVIQMTLVDTWASTAAGAFALSENNLYTVEAFKEYFQHLKPDGMIAITRWEFREPREALRVVSQAMEALREMGEHNTERNFVVVSDGNLDQDGRPVTVLAKRSAFTAEEVQGVSAHLNVTGKLKAIFLPQVSADASPAGTLGSAAVALPEKIVPDATAFSLMIHGQNLGLFAPRYPYNVAPVHDSAPFFFFTLKTSNVIRNVLAGTGRGMDWRINLGIVVLGIVFLISISAVALFLVAPLLLAAEARSGGAGAQLSLLYFIAVGLGYILVEISLIQRFVLFLGHPTYALTVVVFLMLLSSGAGSIVARRWELTRGRRLVALLSLIALLIAAMLAAVASLLPLLVGMPFAAKVLLSGLLLAPLGFLMGMPFPTGLALLPQNLGRIEWAWAMNAAASVLGSVLAMLIAIHFGLNVTQLCGAAAYGMAAATLVRYARRRQAIP